MLRSLIRGESDCANSELSIAQQQANEGLLRYRRSSSAL